MECPCCGSEMRNHFDLDQLKYVDFSEKEKLILDTLIKIYPRKTSMDFILQEMYPFDNEPDQSYQVFMVVIGRLRKKLPAYGWSIPRAGYGKSKKASYGLTSV